MASCSILRACSLIYQTSSFSDNIICYSKKLDTPRDEIRDQVHKVHIYPSTWRMCSREVAGLLLHSIEILSRACGSGWMSSVPAKVVGNCVGSSEPTRARER